MQLVADVLRRLRPAQIYAAGDLSDPHGTHRACLHVCDSPPLKHVGWVARVLGDWGHSGRQPKNHGSTARNPHHPRRCSRRSTRLGAADEFALHHPQALLQAIDEVKVEAWWPAVRPVVWLYRGAWQEWAPHEAHMAVPLMPDEVKVSMSHVLSSAHMRM